MWDEFLKKPRLFTDPHKPTIRCVTVAGDGPSDPQFDLGGEHPRKQPRSSLHVCSLHRATALNHQATCGMAMRKVVNTRKLCHPVALWRRLLGVGRTLMLHRSGRITYDRPGVAKPTTAVLWVPQQNLGLAKLGNCCEYCFKLPSKKILSTVDICWLLSLPMAQLKKRNGWNVVSSGVPPTMGGSWWLVFQLSSTRSSTKMNHMLRLFHKDI